MKRSNGQGRDVRDLIDRASILSEVRLLTSKNTFSHEDAARSDRLIALSDRLGPGPVPEKAETRSFRNALRALAVGGGSQQLRDMGVSSGPLGGYLSPCNKSS
jgi:hypothetical protein